MPSDTMHNNAAPRRQEGCHQPQPSPHVSTVTAQSRGEILDDYRRFVQVHVCKDAGGTMALAVWLPVFIHRVHMLHRWCVFCVGAKQERQRQMLAVFLLTERVRLAVSRQA